MPPSKQNGLQNTKNKREGGFFETPQTAVWPTWRRHPEVHKATPTLFSDSETDYAEPPEIETNQQQQCADSSPPSKKGPWTTTSLRTVWTSSCYWASGKQAQRPRAAVHWAQPFQARRIGSAIPHRLKNLSIIHVGCKARSAHTHLETHPILAEQRPAALPSYVSILSCVRTFHFSDPAAFYGSREDRGIVGNCVSRGLSQN